MFLYCSSIDVIIYINNFSIPHDPNTRNKWIAAIETFQKFDYVVQCYLVCALHFDASDIERNGKRTKLKSGALPKYFS